jgi:succinate dehydrogenase hydrophobic anchor subunit
MNTTIFTIIIIIIIILLLHFWDQESWYSEWFSRWSNIFFSAPNRSAVSGARPPSLSKVT